MAALLKQCLHKHMKGLAYLVNQSLGKERSEKWSSNSDEYKV